MNNENNTLARIQRDISSLVWGIAANAEVQGQVKGNQSTTHEVPKTKHRDGRVSAFFEVDVIVRSIAQCFRVIEQIGRRFRILVNSYDDSNLGSYAESKFGPRLFGYCSFQMTLLASAHLVDVRVRTRGI